MDEGGAEGRSESLTASSATTDKGDHFFFL